jgi:hypothetical protein
VSNKIQDQLLVFENERIECDNYTPNELTLTLTDLGMHVAAMRFACLLPPTTCFSVLFLLGYGIQVFLLYDHVSDRIQLHSIARV